MALDRIDVAGLVDRAEAAVNDLKDAAEDVVRRGLEALVAVGTSAAEALEELDGGEAEPTA